MSLQKFLSHRDNLAWIFVFAFAIFSLVAGWILKESVLNATQTIVRQGFSFQIPARWSVEDGIAGEEMLFFSFPPLERNHRLVVSLLPATPEGKPSDLVTIRTMGLAERVAFFQVTGQTSLLLSGREAYRVSYAYIKQDDPTILPQQILGVETYLKINGKFLVLLMENEREQFESSLAGYDQVVLSIQSFSGN